MTQKYSILWFDDSPEIIEPKVESIKEHVEDLGFEFVHKITPDDEHLNEKWLKELNPDLILVDYGLGNGKKGDKVVETIRKIEPYADVVFYSGKLENYISKISGRIDGVYFTIRDDLVEKTCNVINRTLRKQQEPNNMRGVIIAEAVDIEGKMETLILTALGPDNERKCVIEKIIDPSWVLTFQNKFDLANKICKARIKYLNITKNSIKDQDKSAEITQLVTEITEKKRALVQAQEEVIKVRNIMAHAAYDPKTGCMMSYVCPDPVQINDDFCKTTRNNLRDHSKNLDELISLISKKII